MGCPLPLLLPLGVYLESWRSVSAQWPILLLRKNKEKKKSVLVGEKEFPPAALPRVGRSSKDNGKVKVDMR